MAANGCYQRQIAGPTVTLLIIEPVNPTFPGADIARGKTGFKRLGAAFQLAGMIQGKIRRLM